MRIGQHPFQLLHRDTLCRERRQSNSQHHERNNQLLHRAILRQTSAKLEKTLPSLICCLPARRTSRRGKQQAAQKSLIAYSISVVVTGVSARRQSRLVDNHSQVMILVRLIRARRVERERIECAGILDTTVDLAYQVVAGTENATAALDSQHFQTKVGGTRFLS